MYQMHCGMKADLFLMTNVCATQIHILHAIHLFSAQSLMFSQHNQKSTRLYRPSPQEKPDFSRAWMQKRSSNSADIWAHLDLIVSHSSSLFFKFSVFSSTFNHVTSCSLLYRVQLWRLCSWCDPIKVICCQNNFQMMLLCDMVLYRAGSNDLEITDRRLECL